MNHIFRRKLYDRMLQWKEQNNGRTALLIKGARRVGKSTLAESFAKNHYKTYIKIDFSIAPESVRRLFDDISDLNYLFLQLQAAYHKVLTPGESVIILDEIQKCPLARQAIKHLVADGRYHYIETGSLLSIKRNVKDIIIPSEETRLTLHPMDYEEFRWALGDYDTIPLIRQFLQNKKSLGDALNRQMLRDFRLYMLVGGMPQAVAEYIDRNNLALVDEVKRSILELYEDDFNKIDSSGRAARLFRGIPSELHKNSNRYKIGRILGGNEKPSRMGEMVVDLEDSLTVNISYHANDPNVGLSLHEDKDKFKMYLADTGLFVTLAFRDKDYVDNVIYTKLLSDKLRADLGYVYENMVAQMLRASGNSLFYYTFPTPNGKTYYEIDFLLSRDTKIYPIEVKSSGYKTHASLDAFCEKFSNRVATPYLIYTKDLRKEGSLLYVPIYMTGLL